MTMNPGYCAHAATDAWLLTLQTPVHPILPLRLCLRSCPLCRSRSSRQTRTIVHKTTTKSISHHTPRTALLLAQRCFSALSNDEPTRTALCLTRHGSHRLGPQATDDAKRSPLYPHVTRHGAQVTPTMMIDRSGITVKHRIAIRSLLVAPQHAANPTTQECPCLRCTRS